MCLTGAMIIFFWKIHHPTLCLGLGCVSVFDTDSCAVFVTDYSVYLCHDVFSPSRFRARACWLRMNYGSRCVYLCHDVFSSSPFRARAWLVIRMNYGSDCPNELRTLVYLVVHVLLCKCETPYLYAESKLHKWNSKMIKQRLFSICFWRKLSLSSSKV